MTGDRDVQPQPGDLGDEEAVYNTPLTGRHLNIICNALDQSVRAGGIEAAYVALPVLEVLTAKRKLVLLKRRKV